MHAVDPLQLSCCADSLVLADPLPRVCEAADTDVAMHEGSLLEGRGCALACFVLGRCLHLGKGVPQQPEKAKEQYDKAGCHSSVPPSIGLLLSTHALSSLFSHV